MRCIPEQDRLAAGSVFLNSWPRREGSTSRQQQPRSGTAYRGANGGRGPWLSWLTRDRCGRPPPGSRGCSSSSQWLRRWMRSRLTLILHPHLLSPLTLQTTLSFTMVGISGRSPQGQNAVAIPMSHLALPTTGLSRVSCQSGSWAGPLAGRARWDTVGHASSWACVLQPRQTSPDC